MRRILTILFAGMLIAALTAPAFAWEFSMKGLWENRLRYFGNVGERDLFGVRPLQDGGGAWQAGFNAGITGSSDRFVGFAGPNFYGQGWASPIWSIAGAVAGIPPIGRIGAEPVWNDSSQRAGVRITRGGFAWFGSDALYKDTRIELNPVITVNKALRVLGVYNIGGVRHKYAQYDFQARWGFGPAAVVSGAGPFPNAGVPPFERYYVSQSSMNATDTAAIGSWEQFRAVMQTPWCIFSLGVKPFPLGTGANLGYNTRAEAFLAVVPYGPFRLLYAVWLGRSRNFESWSTTPDGGLKNDFFQGAAITYDNGPLSMGWLGLLRQYHSDNGYNLVGSLAFVPIVIGAGNRDDNTLFNVVYMKYNNGRFFANAEYAWLNLDRYAPVGGTELHIEAYNFFSEAGFTVGPAKFSAMYALSSGPVHNDGNPTKLYLSLSINEQVLDPYQFLMFTTYGGGNDCPWAGIHVPFSGDREYGQLGDAYAFAARFDYAVASNLNVWGAYMWAHRLERAGFLAGSKNETDSPTPVATPAQAQAWKAINAPGVAAAGLNPYVDDGFIGWEANVGVDWKLLEGLTMNLRYAYWQPGWWFNQAYQAIINTPGGIRRDGILGERDAINAFEGKLVIDF